MLLLGRVERRLHWRKDGEVFHWRESPSGRSREPESVSRKFIADRGGRDRPAIAWRHVERAASTRSAVGLLHLRHGLNGRPRSRAERLGPDSDSTAAGGQRLRPAGSLLLAQLLAFEADPVAVAARDRAQRRGHHRDAAAQADGWPVLVHVSKYPGFASEAPAVRRGLSLRAGSRPTRTARDRAAASSGSRGRSRGAPRAAGRSARSAARSAARAC